MKVTKTLIFFWWGWGIIKKLSNHNLAFRKMIFFFWNLETPDWFDIRLKKVCQKNKAWWFDEFFLKNPYLYNRTFSQNLIANVQLWIKSIFSSILGKHIDKASYRTYCLMGDGESMEGNVWEALNFAGKYLNQLFLLMTILFLFDINLFPAKIWILKFIFLLQL